MWIRKIGYVFRKIGYVFLKMCVVALELLVVCKERQYWQTAVFARGFSVYRRLHFTFRI
jgi:hypothetical protein